MTEFITIGEPLVVFAAEEVDRPLCKVGAFRKFIAGAELNVAIGLARLGHSTQYISQVGKDSLGDFILEEAKCQQVGTKFLEQVEEYSTGFYLKEKVSDGDPKVEYHRKNSAASHYQAEKLPQKLLTESKVLHVTGIMAAISTDGFVSVLSALKMMNQAGKLTVFDPNIRPSLWRSQERMIEQTNLLAREAKIILPGVSEGQLLTALSALEDIADFYLKQSEITQIVVIKNGSKGAFVKGKNIPSFSVSSYPAKEVVDTVGAGDGFATGLISGLLDKVELSEAVKRACAIGALAVQSVGDNEGYPTRETLIDFMNQNLEMEIKK